MGGHWRALLEGSYNGEQLPQSVSYILTNDSVEGEDDFDYSSSEEADDECLFTISLLGTVAVLIYRIYT